MIAALWARIQGWALMLLGAAALLLTAWFKGRGDGRESVQREQRDKQVDDIEVKNDIQQDVARRPDGDAAEQLRQHWSRD